MSGDYQALRYFMTAYWPETGDLMYGTFDEALRVFGSHCSVADKKALVADVIGATRDGMVVEDRPKRSAEFDQFWARFGGRRLLPSEAELVLSQFSDSNIRH